MPLYEFCCSSCGKISEFQMKLADPYPILCPECGQEGLKKIMSLPAFQLKGGGWYKDAYDGKSNKKPEASPAAEAKPASSDSSATPATTGPSPAAAASPVTSSPAPSSPSSGSSSGGASKSGS